MAASSPRSRDRSARITGALVGALVLAALGVLLTPGSRRGLAAVMALLGLLAGLAAAGAGLLPSVRGRRTLVERLNDGAFVVVLSVVSLLLGVTARPWTMVVPGLVGGLLAGRVLRHHHSGDSDEPPDRGAPSGSSSGAA